MSLIPPGVAEVNNGVIEVIPVIASFDSSGNVLPLYARIQGYEYKILRCWHKRSGPFIMFYCTVENNRMQKEVIITYHPSDSCWSIKLR